MESTVALASLAALAQETRLRIFRLLVEGGEPGLPAGDIGRALGLPPATFSFHIKVLTASDLVSARPRGRQIRYAANITAMRGLVAYLGQNYCGTPAIAERPPAWTAEYAPASVPIPKPNVRPKRKAA
jgi:DNA-binding transcriptional ArsR family regulator